MNNFIIDKNETLKIFLIDDNEDDILLMKIALKNADIKNEINIANTGKDAISKINEICKTKELLPDIIFLDINLPKLNGIDVLKEIKRNGLISEIPVVIFTSSDSKLDMDFCYELGADLYVKKPNNINEYKIIMQQIKSFFW